MRSLALAAVLVCCSGCWWWSRRVSITEGGVLCGDGLQPFGDACLALPVNASRDTPVVLYLHGMFPADQPQPELEAQRQLAQIITGRGFALLMPRGRLGLCDWTPELASWFCWPSSAHTAKVAAELVAGWQPLWAALDERFPPPRKPNEDPFSHAPATPPPAPAPRRRFLLGYSNGGFFAALLAARGDVPFDGYAIANGGPVEPAWFDPLRPAPVLLLAAQDDKWQAPLMERLHALLGEAGWPHDYRLRKGGHALTSGDVDDALGFFEGRL